MKYFLHTFLFVIGLTIMTSSIFAQGKHGVAYRQNVYNYITPNLTNCEFSDIFHDRQGAGAELAYYRRLDSRTYFSLPVKFGVAHIPRTSVSRPQDYLIGNLDLLLQRNLFKNKAFNPYINFGAGSQYNFKNDHFDYSIPFGLGVNFEIVKGLYLNAQTQYRTTARSQTGWHHGVGLMAMFGGDAEDEPNKADRDKDGVLDLVDRCPDAYGLAEMGGCPDSDGDKVVDIDDKCPDLAGIASMMGCPDTDEDGIGDAEDACPKVKGLAAFKGCPDTDNDGIIDSEDKCPTQPGLAANSGCPVMDKDSDGVPDDKDKCPTEKGPASNSGCPVVAPPAAADRDADGIADKDDACPDTKGTAAGKGCPDTDGDGIYDNADRCPTQAGIAANKGCPEIKQEVKEKLANLIKNVQFETGKATLLTKSYAVLDEVVGIMAQYPEYSLTISGHTDSQGDAKVNQSLSEKRAKTCYDYLVSKGVSSSRMSHAGYGSTQPISDNATKAGRDMNRRVDFNLFVQ
jgi:OmpA-OmpF porin, OOP family